MQLAMKWISPRSKAGSLTMAVLAHALIYGGLVVAFRHMAPVMVSMPIKKEETIDYETLSEPPPAIVEAKPVIVPPEAPKEIQDEKSEVAGVQKVAPEPPAAQAPVRPAGDGLADLPFYKIKPKYPRAALASGVEGWVVMKIDVDEQGNVQNVRVTGGQQRNMFQDEARRAVEKWKYKPFLDANAKPIKRTDHEVRVDFRLQDAA